MRRKELVASDRILFIASAKNQLRAASAKKRMFELPYRVHSPKDVRMCFFSLHLHR